MSAENYVLVRCFCIRSRSTHLLGVFVSQICVKCCMNDKCNSDVLRGDGTRILASVLLLIATAFIAMVM